MAETSLHRELKEIYAGEDAQTEVALDGFRIDAVADGRLIEVQHGSLGAIQAKIRKLVKKNEVVVVKPIIHRKRLVKLESQGGQQISSRRSPKRGKLLDIFSELVHFTNAFPHPNLTIEVALVEVDELRYPGHGRRRRRRADDFQIEDVRLVEILQTDRFQTAEDLLRLFPALPDEPFNTAQLAETLDVARWDAQRIAYCLRKSGVFQSVGKQANAWLYRVSSKSAAG